MTLTLTVRVQLRLEDRRWPSPARGLESHDLHFQTNQANYYSYSILKSILLKVVIKRYYHSLPFVLFFVCTSHFNNRRRIFGSQLRLEHASISWVPWMLGFQRLSISKLPMKFASLSPREYYLHINLVVLASEVTGVCCGGNNVNTL